jgi:hypothetical protein
MPAGNCARSIVHVMWDKFMLHMQHEFGHGSGATIG